MSLFSVPNVDRLKARHDVRGLVKLLSVQDDAATRQMAARALGELRDSQAVPPLVVCLADPMAQMRKEAAWALGQLRDSQAVPPLVAALEDKDGEVHNAAARALGHIGDCQAVEPLIAALHHWQEDVREAAFWALAQIGTQVQSPHQRAQLVAHLTNLLLDEHPPIRQMAATTLEQLGWQPGTDTAGASYWMVKGNLGRCAALGASAVPPLMLALHDPHKELRQAAFLSLVDLGFPAVESLVEVLGSPDVEMRQVAFWALLKIGRPAVTALILVVKHEAEIEAVLIPETASRLLGHLGDERAIQPLVNALQAQHLAVRDAAAAALLKLGQPAIPALVGALQSASEDVRWRAAHVLEQLGWQPGKNELAARYWIALEQWGRCGALGTAALQPLAEAMQHWDADKRRKAAAVLMHLAPRSLPLLLALVQEQNPPVQATAAWALGQMGATEAIPVLTSALQTDAHELCLAAISALVRLQAPCDVLAVALQHEAMLVRKAAAWALGRRSPTQAVPLLISALQDAEADVREVVVRALGELGDARAMPPLLALLNDPDTRVRAAVAEATERVMGVGGEG